MPGNSALSKNSAWLNKVNRSHLAARRSRNKLSPFASKARETGETDTGSRVSINGPGCAVPVIRNQLTRVDNSR